MSTTGLSQANGAQLGSLTTSIGGNLRRLSSLCGTAYNGHAVAGDLHHICMWFSRDVACWIAHACSEMMGQRFPVALSACVTRKWHMGCRLGYHDILGTLVVNDYRACKDFVRRQAGLCLIKDRQISAAQLLCAAIHLNELDWSCWLRRCKSNCGLISQ